MADPSSKRDVFVALAAIAWADGNLDSDEADAIVRAAVEEGLDLDEIAALEAETSTKVGRGRIDRATHTKENTLFCIAAPAGGRGR